MAVRGGGGSWRQKRRQQKALASVNIQFPLRMKRTLKQLYYMLTLVEIVKIHCSNILSNGGCYI
jgi:hypothetical protein